mmetsp:Transcript_43778/g.88537  ORF Transcript_43778/g.88537 Transcript_43778/m.88537 type:complete len:112 (+) Transcript_43778:85-420(+)
MTFFHQDGDADNDDRWDAPSSSSSTSRAPHPSALTRWEPLDVKLDLALDLGSKDGGPLGGYLYDVEREEDEEDHAMHNPNNTATQRDKKQRKSVLQGRRQPDFSGPRGTVM